MLNLLTFHFIRITNEENNKPIKSVSFHKMSKNQNSFAAYMNSLQTNALKNKLKKNSIRTNNIIADHKETNINTNKTTMNTDPKNSSQIKKEKKNASKTLMDFGFVSERYSKRINYLLIFFY